MKQGSVLDRLLRVARTQLPRFADEGEDERDQNKSVFGATLRKVSIVIYGMALAAIIVWVAVQMAAPNGSTGVPLTVALARGPFTVLDYPPQVHHEPRAIILFGSGDGGWTGFEEAMCKTLQMQRYEAVGIDYARYADSDYSLDILQADMSAIAARIRARYADNNPPVIVGGYSMGAAQAIAAAGGPHPPAGLVGVLLVDPRSRGRYGLRLADKGDALPTGPGTFCMDEFTQTMKGLRVVQWHATEDSIDSRTWLDTLTAPHKEYDFGQTGHYYNNDRADFLTQFADSVNWILTPAQGVGSPQP
jgi:pimeloyl-ACP methyl ester carboxylesterase